jgi:hypothetical protein
MGVLASEQGQQGRADGGLDGVSSGYAHDGMEFSRLALGHYQNNRTGSNLAGSLPKLKRASILQSHEYAAAVGKGVCGIGEST